ncbi:MAG: LysR family transcriptional regulator [Hyphomicrobiales bacterium]|nr:LysR family transcriptional regulator [Hyphomicrobiales bacterium]
MNINFKQIEAFVWVADLRSFRRAADRLNTTQPNISTRVSNLEDTLGIKLMERDAGSVRLTSKGKQMLEEARNILRSAERFIDTAGRASQVAGTIKIGVTEMIANTWLRLFLRAVKEQYPQLSIELVVDLSANLKPQLHSRAIDIAFQNGPFRRKTSGSEDLGRFPFIWVGSPELPITGMKSPSKADMQAMPILAHSRDAVQYSEMESHFGSATGGSTKLTSSSSISPCLHMAIEGMGITVLPAAMAQPYIADGRLKVIDYAWVPKPLEFLARYDASTASATVGKIALLARDIAQQYPKTLAT